MRLEYEQCKIAGPMEGSYNGSLFGGFRAWQPWALQGGTSSALVQDAIDRGFITKPGTYAISVSAAEVALVTVEQPEPVKPPLRVAT